MKRPYHILIIGLFLLCFTGKGQATNTMRATQLYITEGGIEYRHTIVYDNAGRIRLETRHASQQGEWQPETQTEWWYDGNHCIRQVRRTYTDGTWHNIDEVENIYNRTGDPTDTYIYHYDNGVKNPVCRTKHQYSNGMHTGREEYVFTDGEASLTATHTYEYDGEKTRRHILETGNERYISELTCNDDGTPRAHLLMKTADEALLPTDSTTWHYDTTGLLTSQRTLTWDEHNETWTPAQRVDYEYDAEGRTLAETFLYWGGETWTHICRNLYTHEDNLLRRTVQGVIYRDWRDLMSIYYDDFFQGQASDIHAEYDFWGGDTGTAAYTHLPFCLNGEWTTRQAEHIHIYYEDIQTQLPSDEIGAKIYPNPSDGIFYLDMPDGGEATWNVYDTNGRHVAGQGADLSTGVIDITAQPAGIYLLRVATAAGIHQQKLIKL